MTYFDYIALAIMAISVFLGLWRGVVGELLSIAAWVIGIWASLKLGPLVGQEVFTNMADGAMRSLAGYGTVFVGVLVFVALIRLLLKQVISALGLSVSDRLLGAVFGLLRGLLLLLLMVGLGGMTSAPQTNWWKSATFSAPLETAVMVVKQWLPEDLAKRIRFG